MFEPKKTQADLNFLALHQVEFDALCEESADIELLNHKGKATVEILVSFNEKVKKLNKIALDMGSRESLSLKDETPRKAWYESEDLKKIRALQKGN